MTWYWKSYSESNSAQTPLIECSPLLSRKALCIPGSPKAEHCTLSRDVSTDWWRMAPNSAPRVKLRTNSAPSPYFPKWISMRVSQVSVHRQVRPEQDNVALCPWSASQLKIFVNSLKNMIAVSCCLHSFSFVIRFHSFSCSLQPRLATQLFKGDGCFVVGVVGVHFAGPKCSVDAWWLQQHVKAWPFIVYVFFIWGEDEFCLTTTLENASHGTDSQATMLTRQIHRTAAKEGRLPNCLYIGADNTPKETKNTTVICWAIFLLASLRDTALSAIEFPVPACRAHPTDRSTGSFHVWSLPYEAERTTQWRRWRTYRLHVSRPSGSTGLTTDPPTILLISEGSLALRFTDTGMCTHCDSMLTHQVCGWSGSSMFRMKLGTSRVWWLSLIALMYSQLQSLPWWLMSSVSWRKASICTSWTGLSLGLTFHRWLHRGCDSKSLHYIN